MRAYLLIFFSRARGERCLRARVVVIGRFVDPRTGAGSAAAILENAHPPVFFAPVGSSSSSVSSRTLAVQELHVGLQSLGRFQADARARSIILLLHHFVVETSFFFLFDRNSCCSSWFAPFSNDIVPSVGEKRRKSHSDAIVVVCLRARGFVLSFLSQEGKRDKKKRREFFFFNKCVCVCECVSPAVRIKPR